MSKEELIDTIIKSLEKLKNDKNIEITNVSSRPEIESWEWFDGTGWDFLSYHYTIKYKQPKKYKRNGGIKEYENI